ncbi:MAG: hypothetical protein ACTHLA_01615 [Asticcacaulis sp.]|uniref:hypothetical protein n=1 Tax=Asticcacaulis sp. TaxID=1872648 RepID=UPI003F7CC3E1
MSEGKIVTTVLHADIINAANDLGRIALAMRTALDHLAASAHRDQRAQLTVLAAAAELAGDKAEMIREIAGY